MQRDLLRFSNMPPPRREWSMKVLLVTPTQSGETVTAVHVAENLLERGHRVAFLSSPYAHRLIVPRLREDVFELTGDVERNICIWYQVYDTFSPHIVIFADYHIVGSAALSFPLGVEWLAHLERSQVCLVTFDHLGFGQGGGKVVVSRRHLHPYRARFFAAPEEMRIMLPCPMHHPGPLEGWRGDPFRYWGLPLGLPGGMRRNVRRSYLRNENDLLIMHSVPTWAWKMAEALHLPFYRFLPEILAYYFEGIGKSITLVSVNNGSLLPQPSEGSFSIVNLPHLGFSEFERLLFSADLVLTENRLSISM